MSYTKLFQSIVTSSLWSEDSETCKVWITLLALADRNGEVQATVPGLARVCALGIPEVEAAIEKFLASDPYSRTPDDDGRRIEVIEGGWVLVNHGKYRAMASREDQKRQNAERQKRFRERQKRNAIVTQSNPSITQGVHIAEAEAEAEAEVLNPNPENNQKNKSEDAATFQSDRTNTVHADTESDLPITPKKEAAAALKFSESVFLKIAERIEVPEDFAKAIYADLELSGGNDRSGKPVVSPASFLRACWQSENVRTAGKVEDVSESTTAQKSGIRAPWQIEADLKRVHAEIDAVFSAPESRMASQGFTLDREAYAAKHEDEWIERLKLIRDEMAEKFPKELAGILRDNESAVVYGVNSGLDNETAELFVLVEQIPDDFPDFDRWAKQWKKPGWVDPTGLTPDASVVVKQLKKVKARYEAELSEAIRA